MTVYSREELMRSLKIKAIVENLGIVTDFLNEQLEGTGCPMKTQMQIELAVEEIFVNIAHYAYAPETGMAVISMDISDGRAVMTFEDSGMPYDPLARPDPDVTLAAEDRAIGGLGIFMVKKSMDDVRYEYRDGKNILTLVKKLV